MIPYLLGLNVEKTEKSEFRAQISQADGSLTPGFVKQRIRSPDTLFSTPRQASMAAAGVGALVFQTKAVEA